MSEPDAPEMGNPDDPQDDDNTGGQANPEPTGGGDLEAEIRRLRSALKKETQYRKTNAERIKELEPLAHKAKELEDSTKSETQRLSEERDAHRSRAERAEQDLLRLRVALRKGLTETQAKRLVGASEEDLEADADELLASFRPASGDEPPAVEKPAGRPKEKLRPGAVPDAESVELNPQKLADLVPRAGF